MLGAGQTITDPQHARAAQALRTAHRLTAVRPAETDVQQRDLADYDRYAGGQVAA